ncbi:MAG TPA: ANTAR domain-containing protein [Kribbella sp.]|nr:ANTAR domain-containing protein [Kribbella sp.]
MTIAGYGSQCSKAPRRPPVTDAEDFAILATALDAAEDLDHVLAQVLTFAAARMNCAGATIHLAPAGRPSATAMTSAPRFTAGRAALESSPTAELILDLTDGKSAIGLIAFRPVQPDGFTTYDLTTAYLIAVHASLAIAAIRAAENLSAAIEANTAIGQALGIMMERCALDADAAFARLWRCAQDRNTKLEDVARQLIKTRHLPGGHDASAPEERS